MEVLGRWNVLSSAVGGRNVLCPDTLEDGGLLLAARSRRGRWAQYVARCSGGDRASLRDFARSTGLGKRGGRQPRALSYGGDKGQCWEEEGGEGGAVVEERPALDAGESECSGSGEGKARERVQKQLTDAGVRIPSSLRDLKKKARARSEVAQAVAGGSSSAVACCAIKRAFASMVFMIRAMQGYTFYMREVLFAEGDSRELMYLLTKEMHTSYVWFFEQVYSCTPKLMTSLMILLANFAAFSMGSNVPRPSLPDDPVATPSPLDHRLGREGGDRQAPGSDYSLTYPYSGPSLRNSAASELTASCGFGSGGGSSRGVEEADTHHHRHQLDARFVTSTGDDNLHLLAAVNWQLEDVEEGSKSAVSVATSTVEGARLPVASTAVGVPRAELSLQQLLEETVKELELKCGEPYHHVYLDQESIRRLVAPVTAKLERDDYACFDRTDLEYNHAISAEPKNPLLLANYAQFLYVVRHKHDSAESLFHRAMEADPADGEVIGRFASFLWLARGDCADAERKYKAAIALDPSNPYFAGSYAHFLWHSEGDGSSCLSSPMTQV